MAIVPIIHEGIETLSLRQLDELNNMPKGSCFRWFKQCEHTLIEGQDYFYLSADMHAELIDQLKCAGQVYGSSRHLLLLTRQGYQRMRSGK